MALLTPVFSCKHFLGLDKSSVVSCQLIGLSGIKKDVVFFGNEITDSTRKLLKEK